ncbi:MAG: Uma2 family endonuclease [Deltaproteobacteria bacterium]|nr:Uma2 family endonuclease [Deltaproteobacteria bacterium]
MAEPARKLPTFDELYAEILALPEGVTGEILGPGWLRTMGRPSTRHSRAAWKLRRGLGGSDILDGGRGWWFEVEPEVEFADKLYVPDIAGWQVAEEPDFLDENPITVVPDWACEILSRSTQARDRAVKLPTYAAAGVKHVWIVDPAARSVEVYACTPQGALLIDSALDDARKVLAPFPHEIDLGSFWRRERATSVPAR